MRKEILPVITLLGLGVLIVFGNTISLAAQVPTSVFTEETVPDVKPLVLATRILNLLFTVVIIAAVIALMWGGLKYIMAGGNEDQVKEAKNLIFYAIIGLVVAIMAFGLVNYLQRWLSGRVIRV